ncbi:MAG: endonuclease III domain-containing protein [Bdellovibrionia bacterium]
MHVLADDGFSSVFEQIIACMISIRTREETTDVVARRFFSKARKPREVLKLSLPELQKLLYGSTFSEAKAKSIREIALQAQEKFPKGIPCDREVLLSFKGIGPKCANLVLSVACQEKRIGVDIHVHRVTNRWGYVSASTPEKTLTALEEKLPRKYWSELNPLLVPFGRNICTGTRPKCSECLLLPYCRQVGVKSHR